MIIRKVISFLERKRFIELLYRRITYNGFMRAIARVFLTMILAGLYLAILGSFFGAGRNVLFDYLSLIPQYSYLIISLFLIVAGLVVFNTAKSRVVMTGLVVPAVIFSGLLSDIVWYRAQPTQPEVLYSLFSWNTANWTPERQQDFFSVMKEYPSDFYLLQEVQYRNNRWVYYDILQEFKDYHAAHYGEYIILSRFPLQCEPPSTLGGYLHCEASTPTGTLDLFNVHLKRPFHVTNFRSFEDFDIRKLQFDALMIGVHAQRRPLIIAGDFNTTANYPFIRTLEGLFEKNNPSGLFVLPHTFPTAFPQFRIDYQFVSKEYRFCGYRSLHYPALSDHLGLTGKICRQ